MAARKKKAEIYEVYSELDAYCIFLDEYYRSLRKAGFGESIAMAMIIDKDSYPAWVSFRSPETLLSEGDDD